MGKKLNLVTLFALTLSSVEARTRMRTTRQVFSDPFTRDDWTPEEGTPVRGVFTVKYPGYQTELAYKDRSRNLNQVISDSRLTSHDWGTVETAADRSVRDAAKCFFNGFVSASRDHLPIQLSMKDLVSQKGPLKDTSGKVMNGQYYVRVGNQDYALVVMENGNVVNYLGSSGRVLMAGAGRKLKFFNGERNGDPIVASIRPGEEIDSNGYFTMRRGNKTYQANIFTRFQDYYPKNYADDPKNPKGLVTQFMKAYGDNANAQAAMKQGDISKIQDNCGAYVADVKDKKIVSALKQEFFEYLDQLTRDGEKALATNKASSPGHTPNI